MVRSTKRHRSSRRRRFGSGIVELSGRERVPRLIHPASDQHLTGVQQGGGMTGALGSKIRLGK